MLNDPNDNRIPVAEIQPVPEAQPVEDQYYILATASPVDNRTRVLKHGDTFGVFDLLGDIRPVGLHEQGVYHEGTRFLSRWQLRIGDQRPLLLNSLVTRDNTLLMVDLTNPDMYQPGEILIPRGSLHILRTKFLWEGICYEQLHMSNHGLIPVSLPCAIALAADFADIFEVRGVRRLVRGDRLEGVVRHTEVTLPYRGLDGLQREMRLMCSPPPAALSPGHVGFNIELAPKDEAVFTFTVSCSAGPATPAPPRSYPEAIGEAGRALTRLKAAQCEIQTSNEQFNEWLDRSVADLYMMVTDSPVGPYPYAGVPWFSTYFGRDGIITALETLWVNPELSRGVLRFLASTQARDLRAEVDAEPGKILHESRSGEMAALGEVPFARYYGSVDATPLFVMLAGAYYRRTGDLRLIEEIWGNVQAALDWMDQYGDSDGDGFVEYARHSETGLLQQGWKDSFDSVFHEDGTPAHGPIALCEVQGYVYAAKMEAAGLARALGDGSYGQRLEAQARRLQERFEEAFWIQDISSYALALDGDKRPCRVRSSNAGHALWTRVASPERARAVAETLMNEASYSGWGIRTIPASEARYNPMSYHNGSVWPHDNAVIGAGFGHYGFKQGVVRLFTGFFEASRFLDLYRMPELICGFPRRPGSGPTLYPTACAPQSWAAGSLFLLLQASLGIEVDAINQQVRFSRPALPEFLEHIFIRNLRVGHAAIDLSVIRYPGDVGVNVVRREGQVDVVVLK